MSSLRILSALLSGCLAACAGLGRGLPAEPPGLRDFDEPLDLFAEPDDEPARLALAPGCFSGLCVGDARDTLAQKLDDPDAVEIVRVVENSPAERAGLRPGDLLVEVAVADGPLRPLRRPSEWRQVELSAAPGTRVTLVVDRAGREGRAVLELEARHRAAEREPAARFREERRVGVVLRTATEVEARAVGLAPGGGAVVVGLAARSPWRAAGLQFGDLLVAIDGAPVAHPQDVLDAVRDDRRQQLALDVVRAGVRRTVVARLSQRGHELHELHIPLLFTYESSRGRSGWSLLLGLAGYERTAAAWRGRLLWLITFGGGDADELVEVGR